MREELVDTLEKRVLQLIDSYRHLQADYVKLQGRLASLEERHRYAVARIDQLLERVQGL